MTTHPFHPCVFNVMTVELNGQVIDMLPFQDKINELHRLKRRVPVILMEVLEDKFQQPIIDAITDDQLFNRGVDSENRKIRPPYAPLTILHKKRVGLPYDRVTLFETGEFHSHVILEFDDTFFTVGNDDPDFPKVNSLYFRYGNDVLGLAEPNIEKIGKMAKDDFIKEVKTEFING